MGEAIGALVDFLRDLARAGLDRRADLRGLFLQRGPGLFGGLAGVGGGRVGVGLGVVLLGLGAAGRAQRKRGDGDFI